MRNYFLLFTALLCSAASYAQVIVPYDLIPGTTGSYAQKPAAYKNSIWLYARNTTQTPELTSVDITTGVKTVYLWALDVPQPRSIAVLGDSIFFVGSPGAALPAVFVELCRMDINGNVDRLTHLSAGGNATISYLTPMDNKIYFAGSSPNTDYPGHLFEYDIIKDTTIACILPTVKKVDNIKELVAFKNKIYFSGTEASATGTELYCYDPATKATTLVADINPGTNNGYPQFLEVIDDRLYFIASTTGLSGSPGVHGTELYAYDGVNAVQRITDLDTGAGNGLIGNFIAYNGKVVFAGRDGTMPGLYQYDPSTQKVQPLYVTKNFLGLSLVGVNMGILYFAALTPNEGYELWRYVGLSKPAIIVDLFPGVTNGVSAEAGISYKNEFFFCGADWPHGDELFRVQEGTGIRTARPADETVKVYPNPMSTVVHFNINTQQPVEISICDVMGRYVHRESYSATSAIDLTTGGYAPGVYNYCIRNEAGVVLRSGRLLKE